MLTFGVQNVTLNQYLRPVHYNMDKILYFGLKSNEERIAEFGAGLHGVLKTLGLIFRGQQRNSGMDLPY